MNDNLTYIVDPRLEGALGASPTAQQIEAWRRHIEVAADASTVLGALLSSFDDLSVEHEGVRATIRWFGSTVYAGDKCLIVQMELWTSEARAAVLALERGVERLYGVPVCADAAARIEDLLRYTIEQHAIEGSLPKAYFFGAVCEFLKDLPGRLVAEAPAESLGRWVLEHAIDELLGEAGELPLPRGQRLSVHIRKDDSSLQPAKDGTWFTPMVELRRTGAKGKLLGATEQQISVGYLGIDTMFEPLPDAAHREAALDVLRRWKAELARRIARMPPAEAKSLMPTDVPWPTSPLSLVVQTLRHGPAGPRPCAGELGALARRTALALRELDDAEVAKLDMPDVMRAYHVGAYTLLFQMCVDDEDERVEESLWVRRGSGDFHPVVFQLDDEAFSADGDEPAYRLFAQWMRLALEAGHDGGSPPIPPGPAGHHDRELPNGVRPSAWLLLQDRDGEPLDHRVVEGMISARSYADIELLSGSADRALEAAEVFRSLVREVIDTNARFGQRVAELGIP